MIDRIIKLIQFFGSVGSVLHRYA